MTSTIQTTQQTRAGIHPAPDMGLCSVGKKRGVNEDYVLYDEGVGACVADGIGQAPLGDAVARYACHAAMRALREGESASAAVSVAQERVMRFISEVDSPRSGTSLVVARLDRRRLDASWAGDTAIFILERGASSVVSSLDARRFATVPPLGSGYRGKTGAYVSPLESIDSIAICTNGAWRSAGAETIGMLLVEGASARRTAARIVLGRESHDDSTALVVRLNVGQHHSPSGDSQGEPWSVQRQDT